MKSKDLTLMLILLAFTSSIFFSYMLKIAPEKSDYIGVWNKLSSNRGFPYLDFDFEYPLLIGIVVKVLAMLSDSYKTFLGLNIFLALISGIGSTILLYKMNGAEDKKLMSTLTIFWVFAPSMLMYSVYNWDLYGIFFMLLSIRLFLKHRFTLSSVSLAIGTCTKLLPIIILPIYLMKTERLTEKVKIIVIVGATWLFVNLPFIVINFKGWLHPYTWQIVSRPPNPDNLWGFLINEFGGGYIDFYTVHNPAFSESLNIILFIALLASYLAIIYFKRRESVTRLGFYGFIIFLLFSKIYSPQYNLWILPFIFFIEPSPTIFYLFDIPSFLILAAHTPWYIFSPEYSIHIATLVILRHIALVLMLWTILKNKNIL